MGTILSVFGINPTRVGGLETFAHELSLQVGQCGWHSILCFEEEPPRVIRDFLNLPNVTIAVVREPSVTSYKSVSDLARILSRYRPDILHLHFTGFLGAFPWLAKLFCVGKVFFTDHGSRPTSYVPKRVSVSKRILARVINLPVTRVISGSQYGCDCFRASQLLPADRFCVVYNAVDFARVAVDPAAADRLRRKYSISPESSLIVQLSWMIPEKGISDLLEAARLVLARKSDVHFLMVGEGSHREHFMQMSEDMGLKEHVTWTGMVQDPFREGILLAADIVCQVSRWQELFGYTIAEAMASCKPVVATRVGGIPEVVQDGVTGFLVPPRTPAEIAGKILVLLEDKALRERMGRDGHKVAESKFNLRLNVAQLLDLYGMRSNGLS
jgi:glycosyltransferase involved in cell wall biosynthesis